MIAETKSFIKAETLIDKDTFDKYKTVPSKRDFDI